MIQVGTAPRVNKYRIPLAPGAAGSIPSGVNFFFSNFLWGRGFKIFFRVDLPLIISIFFLFSDFYISCQFSLLQLIFYINFPIKTFFHY